MTPNHLYIPLPTARGGVRGGAYTGEFSALGKGQSDSSWGFPKDAIYRRDDGL
jgi:hypothetical protein